MFNQFAAAIKRFLHEEDGPAAVEYAVIVALILAACITGVTFLGGETNESFDASSDAIADAYNN